MIKLSQLSFTGGVWSPALYSRSDLQKYNTAARIMRNMFCHFYGGVSNRGGTQFLTEVKDSTKKTKLIPFQFSILQAYSLEFGEYYMRVLKNGELVVNSPGRGTDIVNSYPHIHKWTASGHGTNEYRLEAYAGGDPDLDNPVYLFSDVGGKEFRESLVGSPYVWDKSSGLNEYYIRRTVLGSPADGRFTNPVKLYFDVAGTNTEFTRGTLGSLSAGQFAFGDRDSLGYSTIYVRLDGDADPDSKVAGYIAAAFTGETNNSMTRGTLGSLAAGEFAYGDNDSLGYSTIYVRLSDGTDPDSKGWGYLEASYIYEIVTPYGEDDLAELKKGLAQTADTMYLCHPSYKMRKLTRTDHDAWTLTEVTFSAAIDTPTGLSCSGTGTKYKVAAVTSDWLYSFASVAEEGAPANTLTWTAVADAKYYAIYKESPAGSGLFYYIGLSTTNSFTEPTATITPDFNQGALESGNAFDSEDEYPGACVFYEQRLFLLRTNKKPQTIFGSKVGDFECMGISAPLADDDALEFTINSNQMKELGWGIEVGNNLMLGASDSEYFMNGGQSGGPITPSNAQIKIQSSWGSAKIYPLKIGNAVLFVEGSGKVVRDYAYDFSIDGYKGSDLSVFANHLFEGKKIVSWCYQKNPYKIIWAVLDDGSLLGLTYDKEQQVWGWHQHDTQGFFEDIICLTESPGVDNVYFVVKRYINGSYRRYIEVMKDRLPKDSLGKYDVRNAFILDSGLPWDEPVDITGITLGTAIILQVPNHSFVNGDYIDIDELDSRLDLKGELEQGTVELNGNRYVASDVDASTITLKDKNGNYVDGSEMTPYLAGGKVRKAVLTLSGLEHLEGKKVAILADGNVVSGKTVTNGSITLNSRASRVYIGLGYVSELETLDFDTNLQSGPLKSKLRAIPKIIAQFQNTREVLIGPSSDRATSNPIERSESDGEKAVSLFSGDKDIDIEMGDPRAGRIYARVENPVPCTIGGLIATVDYDED